MNDPAYDKRRDRTGDWPPSGYEEPAAWTEALCQLAEWYSELEYHRFIDDLVCVPFEGGYTIVAPNQFRALYIEDNHLDLIERALGDASDIDDPDVAVRPPKPRSGAGGGG